MADPDSGRDYTKRLYCSNCDSLRPVDMFSKGTSHCKPCVTLKNKKNVRSRHDKALQILGWTCGHDGCEEEPVKGTGNISIMREPNAPDFTSQYDRDTFILTEPEWAKQVLKLRCKAHRTYFVPLETGQRAYDG